MVTKEGEEIEGVLQKYTGIEIRIEQKNGDIYTDNRVRGRKSAKKRNIIDLQLWNNNNDEKVDDPFDIEFEDKFKHLESFNHFLRDHSM